jgi:uncharacterized protein (DUF169 family)
MDVNTLGQQLEHLLGTKTTPIAVAFRDTPPPNVARIAAPQPAGCGYWRVAAESAECNVFYTEASDHFNCPIGAHTHNVAVPPEVGKQLEGMIGTMVELKYLKMADVPSIPRRKDAFGVAIYAPLALAPCDPDVVLVRGNVRQLMLLAEAAQSAGVVGDSPTLGRPTCAVLPQAIETAQTAASFGCIGNRVYTGLGDDEGYFAIPGAHLGVVVANLAAIVNANQELEKFHQTRASSLPAPQ